MVENLREIKIWAICTKAAPKANQRAILLLFLTAVSATVILIVPNGIEVRKLSM
jgi:hypothetical protein